MDSRVSAVIREVKHDLAAGEALLALTAAICKPAAPELLLPGLGREREAVAVVGRCECPQGGQEEGQEISAGV